MAEFLTCLTETSRGVGEGQTTEANTKTSGVDVQIRGDGKATVMRGSVSVVVDTKNYEQSQRTLKQIFAPDLVNRCASRPSLKPPAPKVQEATYRSIQSPTTGRATRSLLDIFGRGITQEFAGEGTASPPQCEVKNGEVTIKIPAGFRSFAGCYLELTTGVDLTSERNLALRLHLQEAAKRLEVKIESDTVGGRREWFLYRGAAPAGRQEITVQSSAPPEVLVGARRLTVALAAGDSRQGGLITILP
jgi:hypothetical protein